MAGEAATSAYRLLINHLGDPDAAYLLMREDGDRLRTYGRARQFDAWFIAQAKTRKDVPALCSRLVAIIGADGGELAWIDALAAVAEPLRTILERELAEREFLPVIERIEAIADSEPAEWTVSTDRGPHRFKVAHADVVVRQPEGAVFITDTDGVRYLVPRFDTLDAESRRLLDSVE